MPEREHNGRCGNNYWRGSIVTGGRGGEAGGGIVMNVPA